jgi:hypothetical protein
MLSRCKQSKVSGIGLLRRLSKLQDEATTNAGVPLSGNSVITISNTTFGKLPKVIFPSEALQFEACHCRDSDKPWNLCRECLGSNSYIPHLKDWGLPRHFGCESALGDHLWGPPLGTTHHPWVPPLGHKIAPEHRRKGALLFAVESFRRCCCPHR